MNDPIDHLPGIEASSHDTARVRSFVLTSGPKGSEPVLFLHGNLATSTFWEETMLALPARFRAAAMDLRGYGLTDASATIDATRGVADWVDDALALADTFGWDRFHLVAHSMGGLVGWGLLALEPDRLSSVTLFAPGPPCGYGAAHGDRGELNHADGAGSGAALVDARFVERLAAKEREVTNEFFSPRATMNRFYWKPPFRPAREEELLSAMLQVHFGDAGYPGDWRPSPHWPGFAPGIHGPINAMAPLYNQWVLPKLLESQSKPRLLWVYGADDAIMRDGSPSDAALQGKLGLRENWPGDDVFPIQPFARQVDHALAMYEQEGGRVTRVVLPGVGHSPFLERPEACEAVLVDHLQGAGTNAGPL